MTATDPRGRESVPWVPQCPACGSGMSEAVLVLGDEMAPKAVHDAQGRTVHCHICGHVAIVGPAMAWLTLAEVRGS